MSDAERFAALLQTPYYSDPQGGGSALKARIDSGDLKIEFAPKNWPDQWYSDPYFNISLPIALNIASALEGVKKFEIYYTRETDFHHIRFEYDGETYAVQWYKVFVVYRKSDCKQCTFGFDRHDIARWFRRGDHKDQKFWSSGGTIANPFKEQES